MNITITLNGKKISEEIDADLLLIDFVRNHGCYSVKRGCETSNCGLCTVFLDEKPVLSCSVLAARADGRSVTTLEGLQDEAKEFGAFIADQGAEPVRILQSWLHYERAGTVPGKRISGYGGNQGISGGQLMPLLRLRGTASRYPGISRMEERKERVTVR